ncbi:helix-turn-helix domain-containing protein [Paenibacillus eucommiae]|uniref:AraC-like DNA-binding protein n=1 Tax=Paenibacillus eucommiae TaxID=1355755 RepID=A0ABS4IRB0_9BACL|nr:helix-turn-helix domain-containing protein [Paenibacillus eucommiae]MBP1990109.1 AraC-like DNA-binding protein [Paenibacillus eucommiae]
MIAKMVNVRKTRQFYFKLISYTLFLSLLPILIISIFLYFNVKTSLKTELHNANSNYLYQTANALEIIISQISNNFEQFTLDSTMRDFEKFPRGSYYEELDQDISDVDLPVLERYINTKAKVRWNLDNLKASNDFIHSVFLIDRVKGITLTSVGSSLLEEEVNAQKWTELPAGMMEFPYFQETRVIEQTRGETRQILPVIYKSPNIESYIIVNLDAELIYSKIVKKLENHKDQTFFILSKNNALLLHDGQTELNVTVARQLEMMRQVDQNATSSIIDYNEKKMLVTYQVSKLLDWTFVRAVGLDGLYQSILHIKGLILFSSFMLVLGMGLLALLASRNMYGPVFRLLAYVKSVDQGDGEATPRATKPIDEFKMIQNRFARSIEDRAGLSQRLQESLPAYKEKFLITLIKSNLYSREEMIERIESLGLSFRLEDLMLMNVYYEDRKRESLDFYSRNLIKLQLVDILEKELAVRHCGFVVDMAEDLFTVVINSRQADMLDVYALADNMKLEANKALELCCTIGIGRHCPDVTYLRQAFDDAGEALAHRSHGGTGEVIYIEDVRLESKPVFIYPQEKEAALNSYVKNGEADQAKLVFTAFVQEVRAQQEKVPYHQLQHAFVQLWVRLMETVSNLQLDLSSILGLKNNLVMVLLQKRDLEEMIHWSEEMIVVIAARIEEAFREKKGSYIHEVIKLVEENSGSELSLSYAADQLGITPAYLSRIFKEKMGMNFLEFLTNARVEKSKKLLKETDWKIKEISSLTGYSNVNYFIRIFKEMTGMTPREYRNMYKSELTS